MAKAKEKTTGSVEVIITKITVSDRYFDIKFKYSIDGKALKRGEINSDYEGWEREDFEEYLKNGGAVENALKKIADDYQCNQK
jgi:hypothetical protein